MINQLLLVNYAYMHVGGKCVRVLLLHLLNGSLCLLLIAACQYHVVASFTQVARRLIAEPRARTRDDHHTTSHRLTVPVIIHSNQ